MTRKQIDEVVRTVFAASDRAMGLGTTAEEHIERTTKQLMADIESSLRLRSALNL